jgi:hypothetical protein
MVFTKNGKQVAKPKLGKKIKKLVPKKRPRP